jgi:hypothetical protein
LAGRVAGQRAAINHHRAEVVNRAALEGAVAGQSTGAVNRERAFVEDRAAIKT